MTGRVGEAGGLASGGGEEKCILRSWENFVCPESKGRQLAFMILETISNLF
jgi:hypothetical protein